MQMNQTFESVYWNEQCLRKESNLATVIMFFHIKILSSTTVGNINNTKCFVMTVEKFSFFVRGINYILKYILKRKQLF